MSTSTTTTTARKVATRNRGKLAVAPKNQKPYSRRDLAAEVLRLTNEEHDPGYLADIGSGSRKNARLQPAVNQAIANLLAKAQAA